MTTEGVALQITVTWCAIVHCKVKSTILIYVPHVAHKTAAGHIALIFIVILAKTALQPSHDFSRLPRFSWLIELSVIQPAIIYQQYFFGYSTATACSVVRRVRPKVSLQETPERRIRSNTRLPAFIYVHHDSPIYTRHRTPDLRLAEKLLFLIRPLEYFRLFCGRGRDCSQVAPSPIECHVEKLPSGRFCGYVRPM